MLFCDFIWEVIIIQTYLQQVSTQAVRLLTHSTDGIPYSGKFSYGANFRIFRMKPRETKIKTAKILTIDVKF